MGWQISKYTVIIEGQNIHSRLAFPQVFPPQTYICSAKTIKACFFPKSYIFCFNCIKKLFLIQAVACFVFAATYFSPVSSKWIKRQRWKFRAWLACAGAATWLCPLVTLPSDISIPWSNSPGDFCSHSPPFPSALLLLLRDAPACELPPQPFSDPSPVETQHFRCGPTIAEEGTRIPSSACWQLLLIWPRLPLAF